MSKKLLFLDTETTSLDPVNGAIVQFAATIRVDGKIKEKFEIRMHPHEGAKIDVNATFNAGHVTLSQEEGHQELLRRLEKYVNPYKKEDKFYIIAYNAKFDCDFIRGWFSRCNNKWYGSYFWNPPIDVMQLAADYFYKKGNRHELENFKLSTIAKYFNLNVDDDKLHDANYDNDITKDVYNILRGNKVSSNKFVPGMRTRRR